ncbi:MULTISPECIES: tol-pal system-associated acyl-CoA thioesterase [Methylococcus]|uniref:Thioesterase family protein n=2 Tax=Methylococcus capsulatus TaxID=414 RepID=Q609K9_METCA|nr:tol-pal system-associated acyl-CoA thioesterase [Methylococcus capsulatus]AAU92521.1 thioesterase family protein [Methylococcus capsulatus str. Bath]QXP88051.1 tol-pal system-associated acyl-CoA thioesterase [Methylococcus capsulatus]QXP90595.1 tol-pal system-associated acyl-CoA thioesterase [Methylococcus capsulatus]QXP94937.1 tol-pal system-associated acyl-CoA thioesterase [Methylococcus capsulatus]UQN13080.1 tol-pal system-associated acyl-CoA thioesterase [Methylococcus capsulatus]
MSTRNCSAMSEEFGWPVRVYYEDTDAGGVVYYANYLKYMERARTEWLRALGFEQDSLREELGVIFAVRSVQVDYLKPARFNDALRVSADLVEARPASFSFVQRVMRGDVTLCEGRVGIVCLAADSFRPQALPAALLKRLRGEG